MINGRCAWIVGLAPAGRVELHFSLPNAPFGSLSLRFPEDRAERHHRRRRPVVITTRDASRSTRVTGGIWRTGRAGPLGTENHRASSRERCWALRHETHHVSVSSALRVKLPRLRGRRRAVTMIHDHLTGCSSPSHVLCSAPLVTTNRILARITRRR